MAELLLREFPEDVRKYLLKIQGKIKADKGICQYSLSQTVYKVVREHQQLKTKK